jgi:hypothetical protein
MPLYDGSMMLKSKTSEFQLVKMTKTQTPLQRFEEQTRKTIKNAQEKIQHLLDKMRQSRLGLDESEEPSEDEWNYE